MYIYDKYVSILVFFTQFNYESLHLSNKQHEMSTNMYYFMIDAFTLYSRISLKCILYTTVLSKYCILVFPVN